ncbi:Clp protease N-terminal domain-containing protein [Micromonospora sp. KC723]|uniref:Clp protease N-terminal domain-containing protein n=1 Tax=Micromonospora sp. KC723 TaxID=2530381 RepID=UPI001045C2D8|nr:Clp protease N-terminal domain-containing protein [Micromonospora sp. KC723]TDB75911.1 Clp protease [Micromonospora sp. KC723]
MGLSNAVRDIKTMRQVLTDAEAEARRAGEDLPAPEHLLVAATGLSEGSAHRAFGRVGADPGTLRQAIERAHATALASIGITTSETAPPAGGQLRPATGVFRATPQAQQVWQQAVTLSKSARPPGIRGAHVVAAVCSLTQGTAVRALAAMGVDPAALRRAALVEGGIEDAPQ